MQKAAGAGAAEVQPYIPASQSLKEITVKAIVLGIVLSAIMGGANAYLGLKVGLTVSASIPAAVISMAILRFFRESNILENNIVQTAASSGEAIAAGVIFTLPALIIMGYWEDFSFLPIAAIAVCGGTLGVLFTIPLRRALIVEAKLQFPEGVATGEVLKAGTEGGEGARLIAIAGLAGGFLKLAQTGFKLVAGKFSGAFTMGGATFGFGSELGVALLGVGFIVGRNIATVVFAGGLISWLFGIPIFTALHSPAELQALFGDVHGYELAEQVWSKEIRYMGVGAMATGGLWALLSLLGPVKAGFRSSIEAVRAARAGVENAVPRTERDTPITIVGLSTLVCAVPIFIAFLFVVDKDALGVTSALHVGTAVFGVVFALFAGFLFSSVAGYMAGLVGSSNNPVSGVTIATVLSTSGLLLVILGSQIDFEVDTAKATAAAASAILVGAVVCCAAAIAGDNMQDLKTGQIVGATPWKQQVMQIVGTITGALVIAPVLSLLFNAYGLGNVFPRPGMDTTEALAAPQATLMSSVAEGVFHRNLPWGMILVGVAIAVAIIIVDKLLERRGSNFRTPVLALAVGIYLPIELTTPMFIGGMVAYLTSRALTRSGATAEALARSGRRGLLFASGLITGEALIGIVLAVPFALKESTDALRLAPDGFGAIADVLGLVGLGLFVVWMYRLARRND